jgi:hypothetical protein
VDEKIRFGEFGTEIIKTYSFEDNYNFIEAKEIIDILNAPASPELITGKLMELSLLTAPSKDDFETYKAKIALYVKKLKGYPADLLIETIEGGFKFFPSFYEIEERLKGKMALRRMKFRKLMR